MQTNHIPQEILFARSIRRHIRRLAHVVSEEHLVTELLIKKLSPFQRGRIEKFKSYLSRNFPIHRFVY